MNEVLTNNIDNTQIMNEIQRKLDKGNKVGQMM